MGNVFAKLKAGLPVDMFNEEYIPAVKHMEKTIRMCLKSIIQSQTWKHCVLCLPICLNSHWRKGHISSHPYK